LQALNFGCSEIGLFLTVSGLQSRQIALDTGFDLLPASLDLVGCEIVVAVVDRLEFAAVNSHRYFGQQV